LKVIFNAKSRARFDLSAALSVSLSLKTMKGLANYRSSFLFVSATDLSA
jgi:hypothetical protein